MSFIDHCSLENPISFFQMSWKNGLPKKIALEYDLSCTIGKDDISRKKIHGDMIFSSNVPKRWSSKRFHRNMIVLVLSWKMVFFTPKTWYFFLGRKMKDNLSQEIYWNMIFSVYTYKCYKYDIIPSPAKKNQRWSSPTKIHLNVIKILEYILKRVPMILCTFMKTFIGVFIYCFPVKKIRKLNIQDWSFISSSIYLVEDIKQWRIFNSLYHSALRSCIYERHLRKSFGH